MNDATDTWYVQFPDGRVLRATSRAVLRQQLLSGRIPSGSLVRRSRAEDWVRPEDVPGLTEPDHNNARDTFHEPVTVASRVDPAQLRLVGVRPLLAEFVAALDSTLVAKKLIAAALVGLALGALLALSRYPLLPALPEALPWALAAVAVLLVAWLTGLLARLTYVELAQMRPARWREGLRGLRRLTVQLALTQGLVLAALAGLFVLLRKLPSWLVFAGDGSRWAATQEALVQTVVVAGMLIEAVLWPFGALVLLLGPVFVVEQCGAVRALRQWLALLRRDLGRVLLCTGMALAIGALATAPLALPLLTLLLRRPGSRFEEVADAACAVVAGLTLAPLLAYLIVANVFIYLHLRYEPGARR
jgi:hypothetical protein